MKRRAFTLLELTIVILIIGVLATLGVPAFQQTMENSRERVCQANIRVLQRMLEVFMMENNRMPADMLELAKGNTRLIRCPSNTGGGNSYGIFSVLFPVGGGVNFYSVGMRAYSGPIIADCGQERFDSESDLAGRHTGGTAFGVDRNGVVSRLTP